MIEIQIFIYFYLYCKGGFIIGKIKIKCDTCNKEFEKYECKLGKNNFCCRECYLKFHSKNVPTCKCEICGKFFKGSKHNANRFCSRNCYNQFHDIKDKERKCLCCKKIFIAKTSKDKYCSQECHLKTIHSINKGQNHWNWQGGITSENEKLRNSVEYKNWQQEVYKRDDYCCQICNKKKDINAHHLWSWKEYPELRFDITNGITLCKKCHILTHKNYGWTNKDKMSPDFLKTNKQTKE